MDDNKFNKNLETKKSLQYITPKIELIDKYLKKVPKDVLKEPEFRKYTNKPFKKTEYAYTSLLMVSEEYLPAILVLGYTLRKYKNKYNVVCMVQDKPTHKIINGEKKYFPGVSKNSIDEILKIYDVVYGVDLIKTITHFGKYHFTEQLKHYKNISVYTTKSQVFGLLDYKRVLFLDASLVVHKNIDYLFTEYSGNTFLNEKSLDKSGMGLNGSVFIIQPSKYYYNKALLLSKYYAEIFKNYYLSRGIDEIILYFTIYPDWSNKLIKLYTRCVEKLFYKHCPIYNYQIHKPFKVSVNEMSNSITFKIWDKFAKELLTKYPYFLKYFKHIRSFRNVDF